MKLTELSLEALYSRPKITTAVEEAIVAKENFASINKQYCETVCQLKCKSYIKVQLKHKPADVLILQDHKAIKDGYKSGIDVENIHQAIIKRLADQNLYRLKYETLELLKCPIEDEDIQNRKPPLLRKLMKCKPYLDEEIRKANPKVIISLTTNTTKALGFTKLSNSSNRGEIHNLGVKRNGIYIIVTLHPKVTTMIRQNSKGKMWGPDFYEVLDRDFEKAGRIARGELIVPELHESIERYKKDIVICRSIEQVISEVNQIYEIHEFNPDIVLSWDTETTGLDPWSEKAKLITMQFGYKDPQTNRIKAVVFPLWHRENLYYNADEAWEYIAQLLSDTRVKKVGHNVKFDILYTYATTGLRVKGIAFDSMLILHSINSGIQGNYGLKGACWDFLPETGLGGYEDLLPRLKALKSVLEASTEVEEEVGE